MLSECEINPYGSNPLSSTKGDNTKNSSVFYWQSIFNNFSISLEIAAMVKF